MPTPSASSRMARPRSAIGSRRATSLLGGARVSSPRLASRRFWWCAHSTVAQGSTRLLAWRSVRWVRGRWVRPLSASSRCRAAPRAGTCQDRKPYHRPATTAAPNRAKPTQCSHSGRAANTSNRLRMTKTRTTASGRGDGPPDLLQDHQEPGAPGPQPDAQRAGPPWDRRQYGSAAMALGPAWVAPAFRSDPSPELLTM